MAITTRKGRVVYDRKPHLWDFTDVQRVCKKIGLRQIWFSADLWEKIKEEIFFVIGVVIAEEAAQEDIDFGGGEFGGGGATRPFKQGSKPALFSDDAFLLYNKDAIVRRGDADR